MTPMERHDAVCALLDLAPLIVEHKVNAELTKLNVNSSDYDPEYEHSYYTRLLYLRRAEANRILG